MTKKAIASSPELLYMRANILNKFEQDTKKIIIVHLNSFIKKLPAPSSYKENRINLKINNEINREEFEEVIVDIGRVTKVVKGGRRFRFTALVVVGDKKGRVGFGFGKAKEVPDAMRKATDDAFKNIVEVKLKGSTIPHDVEVKYNASRILLKPVSEGTGVIAGGGARPVVELAGIKNILTKSLGSNNSANVVRATIKALCMLKG